jgi:cellulose synthase/poly-beta-1,6-N-acetylglucosamine synthase-like glycosyltransferase
MAMGSREEWLAQKEIVEKALREIDEKDKTTIPIEVTVAMVVASDLATDTSQKPIIYLGQTFRSLEGGAQCVPLNVVICPVVPDTDGANTWLCTVAKENKWPASQFGSFKIIGPIQSHGDPNKNVEHALKILCENVKTEYVMFVDADTEPQTGVVFDLLAELKKNKTTGIVGARYERVTDHVKLGCSMMRTKIAKDINWRSDNGCVCRWLCHTELPRRGLKAVHIDKPHRARHLRREL